MNYCFADGQKGKRLESRETCDFSEVTVQLDKLAGPKHSLMTSPPGLDGYLDFYIRDDGSIEMEIMERGNDDFATVDIETIKQVIEIAMTDTRTLLLRQKLDGLRIDWIT
jgi:hypothetical protein